MTDQGVGKRRRVNSKAAGIVFETEPLARLVNMCLTFRQIASDKRVSKRWDASGRVAFGSEAKTRPRRTREHIRRHAEMADETEQPREMADAILAAVKTSDRTVLKEIIGKLPAAVSTALTAPFLYEPANRRLLLLLMDEIGDFGARIRFRLVDGLLRNHDNDVDDVLDLLVQNGVLGEPPELAEPVDVECAAIIMSGVSSDPARALALLKAMRHADQQLDFQEGLSMMDLVHMWPISGCDEDVERALSFVMQTGDRPIWNESELRNALRVVNHPMSYIIEHASEFKDVSSVARPESLISRMHRERFIAAMILGGRVEIGHFFRQSLLDTGRVRVLSHLRKHVSSMELDAIAQFSRWGLGRFQDDIIDAILSGLDDKQSPLRKYLVRIRDERKRLGDALSEVAQLKERLADGAEVKGSPETARYWAARLWAGGDEARAYLQTHRELLADVRALLEPQPTVSREDSKVLRDCVQYIRRL